MKHVIVILLLFVVLQSGCRQEAETKPQKAILTFILGDVQIDGQPPKINQELNSNVIITTGEKSRAEVRMGSASGIQVRQNSKVKLLKTHDSWRTEVTHGAVLNLLRPGSKYQLSGPAGVIAVRGTIFYVNCYPDGSQYVCTCNGTVGISNNGNELREVSAFHHEPYTIIQNADNVELKPTEMKEHDDLEIFEFMYRIERNP